ncbi:hypothetical protein PR202_ga16447 [Eleusine coracana subsp. coracana]|uniref:Damage-control phosphatase ARMT1-like metal-binding domain-containing protein n=1 Tax=Eleusine coracana subsp. coracana TaxID=191504 RepID=A0AAV5CLN3_ELECO|nr:hypothetical protein PR202_ga16447 [Eleusine coracana subsp. coracana]
MIVLSCFHFEIVQISWMEKFVQKGTQITAPVPMGAPATTGMGGFERPTSKGEILRSDASAALNVGVLHLVPTLDVFPLLEDPKTYEPNTIDLDQDEFKDYRARYWFKVLSDHSPDLVDKAVASEGGTDDAKRRGDAFAHAFSAHLARLMEEPAAYGKFGLANLLELREECLREFQFVDAYISIKQRENEASLAVLPDLLMELDSMNEIDDFDVFKKRMLTDKKDQPYKRALLFVDNSGADVVLGMLPLARELLRQGTEVVLVANSLPALNDVTANELPEIVAEASKHCGILRKAAEAGGLIVDAMAGIQGDLKDEPASVPLMVVENGCGSPCIDFRQVSSELAAAAKDADLLILEGMGRALHTNLNARFKCDTLKVLVSTNLTHLLLYSCSLFQFEGRNFRCGVDKGKS